LFQNTNGIKNTVADAAKSVGFIFGVTPGYGRLALAA